MSNWAISGLTVLLVDDIRATRAILKALLRTFGIQDVLEANNGAEALEILRGTRPDLVITDLSIIPVDGIEFTRRLRRRSSGQNALVPVIVVTAHNEMSRVQDALEAGVTEFLLKPVAGATLARKISALIQHPRAIIRENSYYGPDRRRRSINAKKRRRAADAANSTTVS